MPSVSQIATQLGASVPSGAFEELESGVPSWVTQQAERTWSVAMGGDDARALARNILGPVVRDAARELARQAKSGKIAGAVGPAVVAAIPIVGQAAAAIAYFAQALAKGAISLKAQRDIVREGKRETLIRNAMGFKRAQVHGFVGPWDGRECNDWMTPFRCRDYTFWRPAPAYSPILEIAPCCFPAWIPYVAPGPHVPPKVMRDKSQMNDLLVAAQLEAWSDPAVLAWVRPETLSGMYDAMVSAGASGKLVFRDATGAVREERALADGELELMRAGIGGVAAAREALFRENPSAVRAALTRTFRGGEELSSDAPPDALEVARSAPATVVIGSGAAAAINAAIEANARAARLRTVAMYAPAAAILGVIVARAARGSRGRR